jgi:hypothetical protein
MLLAVFQDAEKGTVTPALPQARQDALLPELRSRFAKILDVPRGRSQSLLAQGWVGEISVRLRFCLPLRPRWMTFLSILIFYVQTDLTFIAVGSRWES